VPRVHFLVPDRRGLPPLSRYATLQMPSGERRPVAYTEATRGCKHMCRHCPVVPIYNGQFRIVPSEIVLADIEAQIAAGARHVTFGDPDFLNGPTHALRVVDALHAAHPGITYDATIKVEHLLKHRDLLPRLVGTGCLFVTSAVESIDDRVLVILDKGHTRQDFVAATELCRTVGLTLVPTFVAFHPWLTLGGYCDLLDTIGTLGLIDHVAPIQLAIRLLIPGGSRLLTTPDMAPFIGEFDEKTLTYRWTHPDARVDVLQREIGAIVGARLNAGRAAVFAEISRLAHGRAGRPIADSRPARDRATVPYLNEPWYC
ncbi:MAG TPA: radical SAM protein, partial [Vicinamibacterales bacterium]